MFSYGFLHIDMPGLADQLCVDTGCSLEDLSRAMNDRGGYRHARVGWSEKITYVSYVWTLDAV